ncbi:MAG: alpha/beta fold hydrolase [Woeseia sp.]
MNDKQRTGASPRVATTHCTDGFPLQVAAFEPARANGQLVLLAAAAGVPGRFYHPYAAWLAQHGYTAIAWDWRGMGNNRPDKLRGFKATMMDWATLDFPAVIDWAYERYGMPMIGIGHSFGGQAFGLAGRNERFSRLVLLAAGTGYLGLLRGVRRYLYWSVISALSGLTRLYGYLPGKSLGLGADVPKGVAVEWFRWCRRPEYLGNWEGHRRFTIPVQSLGFSDDHFAPPDARQWLLDQYSRADTGFSTVTPQEAGLEAIGHLDFFRRHHEETLWPLTLPLLGPGMTD